MARPTVDEIDEINDKLIKLIEALRDNARLVEALQAVEWVVANDDDGDEYMECPWCCGVKPTGNILLDTNPGIGHDRRGCLRQTALSASNSVGEYIMQTLLDYDDYRKYLRNK